MMAGMRRCLGVVAVLFSLTATLLATPGPGTGAASALSYTSLPAMASDAVVDAYGVGIHLPFLDTPYVDATRVADALTDLGVRHVRDDLFLNDPRQYDGLRTVAARGIGFNLIMGRPDRSGTPADYVRTVAELPTGAVESVEGINEWDLFGATRPEWAGEAALWQQQLYSAVKADPRTAHLPVLSPSMAFKTNYGALPDLSPWSDRANAHMYPGGRRPTNEVTQITSALRAVVPSKPLVVTEAGYHNAVNTTGGHLPVSEAAAATYLPRLLLEHVRSGHERVYSYELIDEFADPGATNPEAHFGLLRRDWTPKPAYTAMRSLLGLLADPGPAFVPRALLLASTGWPGDGRYLVTQKRDGSYVVLLWRDTEVYDPVLRRPLPDPVADVRLHFPRSYDMGVHRLGDRASRRVAASSSITVPIDGTVTALTLRVPVPDAPVVVSRSARKGAVKVVWRAPRSEGAPIRAYRLSWRGKVLEVGAGARRATLRGLPRHKRLRVSIRARNVSGLSRPARTTYVRTR